MGDDEDTCMQRGKIVKQKIVERVKGTVFFAFLLIPLSTTLHKSKQYAQVVAVCEDANRHDVCSV